MGYVCRCHRKHVTSRAGRRRVATGRSGRSTVRVGERLPGVSRGSELFAADGARVRVRPARGVPRAGGAGHGPGCGDNRCAAGLSARVPGGEGARPPVGERGVDVGAAAGPLRGSDDQPSTGGDHRVVRVSADAHPDVPNPVPKGREARSATAGERTGLLAHLVRPKRRSALRLREPRRLPRALDRRETAALLGSLRSWQDRAMAGLMLLCGLRAGERKSPERARGLGRRSQVRSWFRDGLLEADQARKALIDW